MTMALCLKRRSAPTSSDEGCNRTTFISFLTLAIGLVFLVVRICNRNENRKSPFETSSVLHNLQETIQSKNRVMTALEIRLHEVDKPQPAFLRSVVETSLDGSNRLVQEISLINEQLHRTSKADSSRNKDELPWFIVNRESSANHVKWLRHISLLQAVPGSTHKSKQSTSIGMNKRISRLVNVLKRSHEATSQFQRRKLHLKNLSESRQAKLPSKKTIYLDQHSIPNDTRTRRPADRPPKTQLCCLCSYELCQEPSMQVDRRGQRRKRSANEEDLQKLKKFLIRLLEATMSAEERRARNLTDLHLDPLLKDEQEFSQNADERNRSKVGTEKNTELEQKNETAVENNAGGKGNIAGNSETGRNNAVPKVGESNLGVMGGEGFGNFALGGTGGAEDGKLIITAQIANGSKSKELAEIVVDPKNGMEVAIKVTNTSNNTATEQKKWTVELNGEQKMFVVAVIAIASIVAVGTLVFACVWCLYDQEGLCTGFFPCIRPPKDNFSPQRWWMETLARRVENLESQPFLATEKHKRRSTSQKYQLNNEEGRLSQMVSRLSERISKGSPSLTKKEQMARNSQMARASQMERAGQVARDSQMTRETQVGNGSQMTRDSKMVRESVQRKESLLRRGSSQQRKSGSEPRISR